MKKRAIRRHHRRRVLNKWKKIADQWDIAKDWKTPWIYRAASVGSISCSKCYGCINPRTRNELTIQERKAEINEAEYLQEVS